MYKCVDNEFGLNEKTPILNPIFRKGSSRFSNAADNCLDKLYKVIPARYVFAIISCIGFANVYAMRANLSVAMVAMVGKHSDKHFNVEDMACKELLSLSDNFTLYSNVTIPRHGEFDWDMTVQSHVLGSFFWGYVLTQIPGGMIAEKYGAKWLYGTGVLVTAIFTLMTPLAARWGPGALITVRFIEGLGEGVTFPAMHALMGRWVPKNERSRIATLIHIGSPIGNVVSMIVSGYLSSSYSHGGWPMVFYLFGMLGCVWFVFWIYLIYESPEEHPRISRSELQYIKNGLDQVSTRSGRIPWRSIFTSVPVLALTITHFGHNWCFYTVLTELPTYLANILHFEMKDNGVLSALPYLFQSIFAFAASGIADRLTSSGRYKITTIRKIINSIAFFIPCILIACIFFAECDAKIIVTLIVLSVGFSGFMYSGFNVTHIDMSPEFAGTLMGITNCVANTSGFLAPVFVGSIIKHGQTVKNWQIVFLATSAVYLVSGLVYLFFASAELQPWGLRTTPASTDEEAAGDKKESPK